MAYEFTRVRMVWEAGTPTRHASSHLDFSWVGAAPTIAELATMAEAAQTSARTGVITWDQIAAAGYPLVHCAAQNMQVVPIAPVPPVAPFNKLVPTTIERKSTGAVAPAGAATSLTPAPSQIVSLLTALPGRSRRGRCYLPGGAEADASNAGIISAGDANANADFLLQLVGAVLVGSPLVANVVVSLALDDADDVVDWVGRTSLATQRRRQAYVS